MHYRSSSAFPVPWGGSGGKAGLLAVGDRHPEERRGPCRMGLPRAELSVEKLLDPEQGRSGQWVYGGCKHLGHGATALFVQPGQVACL